MSKLRPQSAGPASASGRTSGLARGRDAEEQRDISPPARVASYAMRLAAEVEALKAELATARGQIATLQQRADTDPLLDLFNRRGFERELARSLAYVRRYGTAAALVFLDLDRFKSINDTQGHPAGDAVLKAVGTALLKSVRSSDVVGRLGGDEFAILLWNIDEPQAFIKSQVLEGAVAAVAVDWRGDVLTTRASAGATPLLRGDRVQDVLARADAAMYQRKNARRHDTGGS